MFYIGYAKLRNLLFMQVINIGQGNTVVFRARNGSPFRIGGCTNMPLATTEIIYE